MLKIRNVLSLFDGIGCGQVALERAGIKYDNYYASEIDKYAIQVTQKNYPDTIQLGDINNWKSWEIDWSSIDLIMGGSPCQGFSNAGKGLNFDDTRSKLFFVFVDILNHIKQYNPKVIFLLENVKMKKDWQDIITEYMGVEPVEINSALVSAQQRRRLYWTNIKNVSQPENKGILLKDILLTNAIPFTNKSYSLTASYSGAVIWNTLERKQRTMVGVPICVNSQSGSRCGKRKQPSLSDRIYSINAKNPALTSSYQTKIAEPVKYCNDKNMKHLLRPYGSRATIVNIKDEKTPTLISAMGTGGGNGIYYAEIGSKNNMFEVKDNKITIYDKEYEIKLPNGFYSFRKLHPIECERLQTLPDNYTDGISNSQRYKALGNGWTVDVIVHILKGLKEDKNEIQNRKRR